MVSALIVTHYYRERESNLHTIVDRLHNAVDMIVVASNNPPPPVWLPDSVKWVGSTVNLGTRLRVWTALALGVDEALLVDDDVAPSVACVERMREWFAPGAVVGLWGAQGLLNGRIALASRAAMLRWSRHVADLPTPWCDDVLLGAVGSPTHVIGALPGEVEHLYDSGRSLEVERAAYTQDRVDTILHLQRVGLLSESVVAA